MITDTRTEDTRTRSVAAFWLQHDDGDWSSNKDGYYFGTIRQSGLAISAVKQPDGMLVLNVSDTGFHLFTFQYPIPACDGRGLYVEIVCEPEAIKLRLNGRLIQTHPLPCPSHEPGLALRTL